MCPKHFEVLVFGLTLAAALGCGGTQDSQSSGSTDAVAPAAPRETPGTHVEPAAGENQLVFAGDGYPVVEARIFGWINVRRDGSHVTGFNLWIEAGKGAEELPSGYDVPNAEAAGIPLAIRSWKELDGLTVKDEGGNLTDFSFYDGHEFFTVTSNTWSFKRIEGNKFHVKWTGDWEWYEGGDKNSFSVDTMAQFTGIQVAMQEEDFVAPTGAVDEDEARQMLAEHFVAADFAPNPTKEKRDYVFPMRLPVD